MRFYPVSLSLHQRPCVVIGGGRVAERKVGGLLAAGALVTVVSPALTPGLRALARRARIRHVRRRYRPGDLAGAALAFATTGDTRINAEVADEGRAHGVWVNAADDPVHCDFILPAVLRRGGLEVSVGTGGASPALSRAVRDQLARVLGRDYARLTRVVADVRREVRGHSRPPAAAAWHRALAHDLPALAVRGDRAALRRRLLARLGAA
jgi:siroheme synthase-like protein